MGYENFIKCNAFVKHNRAITVKLYKKIQKNKILNLYKKMLIKLTNKVLLTYLVKEPIVGKDKII